MVRLAVQWMKQHERTCRINIGICYTCGSFGSAVDKRKSHINTGVLDCCLVWLGSGWQTSRLVVSKIKPTNIEPRHAIHRFLMVFRPKCKLDR